MADKSLSDKLCTASAQGQLLEVLNLLKNGAPVNGYNSFNRTALQVVKLGSNPVVKALVEAGANPNLQDPACGLTVVHDVALNGFGCTLRTLLGHGADVNLMDKWGNLPLHLAAREGHLDVVRLLIRHTANPRAVNGDGHAAGQLAEIYGKEDTAAYIEQYLKEHGL